MNTTSVSNGTAAAAQQSSWYNVAGDLAYCIGMPIVCVPGIIVCSMSLTVFCMCSRVPRLNSHGSLLRLLTVLSAFDLAVLISSWAFVLLCQGCYGIQRRVCYVVALPLFYPLSSTMQFCSVWLCVVITMDRYIAVCHPMQHLKYNACHRRIHVCIGVVLAVGVLCRLPKWFEFTLGGQATWLRKSALYMQLYDIFSLVSVIALPWIIMLVCNVRVFAAIKHRQHNPLGHQGSQSQRALGLVIAASKDRRESTQSTVSKVSVNKAKFVRFLANWKGGVRLHKSAVMVALVSGSFVICYAPSLVSMLLPYAEQSRSDLAHLPTDEREAKLASQRHVSRFITSWANLMVCFNSATNFVVYYFVGSWFRRMVKLVFFQCSPSTATESLAVSRNWRSQTQMANQSTLNLNQTRNPLNQHWRDGRVVQRYKSDLGLEKRVQIMNGPAKTSPRTAKLLLSKHRMSLDVTPKL